MRIRGRGRRGMVERPWRDLGRKRSEIKVASGASLISKYHYNRKVGQSSARVCNSNVRV